MLEALLVSTLVVAVGELGDKTQLLTLVLAARYRKPWPIIAGILVATLANHTVAAWIGQWVRDAVPSGVLRWGLALSFFAVAAWALKPEIGDKTQIATAMLAAKFDSLVAVVAGTTLGMLLVDAPTAFLGDAAAKRIPFRAVRIAAAALFAGLGVWVLVAPHFAQ